MFFKIEPSNPVKRKRSTFKVNSGFIAQQKPDINYYILCVPFVFLIRENVANYVWLGYKEPVLFYNSWEFCTNALEIETKVVFPLVKKLFKSWKVYHAY